MEHEGQHPNAHTESSTPATPSPLEVLQSRSYVVLLVFGAIIGVPVAVAAYFFLEGFTKLQQYLFGTLPGELGFESQPVWWPIPLLALSGLLVALTIQYLPGTAGHKPAEGFKASGPVPPIELPGIVIASFATLSLGAVLGPEAPLIAIGSGLGVLAVHLVKRDAPESAIAVIGAAGSFAAISTLLGSPLPAAFLMMEVAGIGGAMLGVVLAPGLLAAGVGSLIFIGLDNWTGFGTFSLSVPNIPPAGSPRVAEFLWAIAIGVIAAILGSGIKRLSLLLQPIVERRKVLLTPLVGLAIGVIVLIFVEVTGRSSAEVLFSGQDQLPGLIEGAAGWTVGALLMIVVCKGLAYSLSLSSFRGGPYLSEHVHRRCRRNCAFPPSRSADDRGCCNGHWRAHGGDVGTPAHIRSHRERVPRGRRREADTARDRRRRCLLRRLSPAPFCTPLHGPLVGGLGSPQSPRLDSCGEPNEHRSRVFIPTG